MVSAQVILADRADPAQDDPGDNAYPAAVSLLTAFGALAVGAMLLFYALEDRSAACVLAFAGACVASSIYGFLQGAWPFGVVELIWSAVALRRWRRRTQNSRAT